MSYSKNVEHKRWKEPVKAKKMETKWLTIQSFEKSQSLLESINKLIIHLKLKAIDIDDRMDEEEITFSQNAVKSFLKKLSNLAESAEKQGEPMTGVDIRFRKLVRNFIDAKAKTTRYKSVLFRTSPQVVLDLLENKAENNKALIDSLTELGTLLEDHVSIDARELIGEI